jgi:hypothetical protein
MIYFLSLMSTYFTVLRCIISVKILNNGLFSYWIFFNEMLNYKNKTGILWVVELFFLKIEHVVFASSSSSIKILIQI